MNLLLDHRMLARAFDAEFPAFFGPAAFKARCRMTTPNTC
jgi:hypothetical protein